MMKPGEYRQFVNIFINIFNQAEREAWGSLFCHAERAGWIAKDLDAKVLHR